MRFYISGLIELLLFLAVIAGLVALRHTRLDNYLAIAWVSLMVVGFAGKGYALDVR